MNKWIIFAHFDINSVIDNYVIYYLKELKKISANIVFVSDCNLAENELNKLNGITFHNIAKKHGEYDWGSYKYGFRYLDDNKLLNNTDELIFCNDSVYGPIYPLNEYIEQMSNSIYDFTGFFENQFGLENSLQRHIQSWFLMFKKQVFTSEIFKEFIYSVKKLDNKIDIINNYEINCTKILSEKFSFKGLFTSTTADAVNRSPFRLIDCGFPFCKVHTVTNYNVIHKISQKNRILAELINKHQKRYYKKRNIFVNFLRNLKYIKLMNDIKIINSMTQQNNNKFIKIFKYIKFFIQNFIKKVIINLISLIPRDKNIIVTGLCTKNSEGIYRDYFMHNTKYLYLYLTQINNHGFKVIYLCENELMRKKLKEKLNAETYSRRSFKGIYYKLRAKYWLYDNERKDLPDTFLSGGATCICFWHGILFKKVGYEANMSYQKCSDRLKKIFEKLMLKDSYYCVNSEYDRTCYKTAFLTDNEHAPIIGSPRHDVLLNDISNSDLFIEKDYNNIKRLKEQGKILFFYLPTFRDTGKDVSGWLKSEKVKQFLKNNNIVLVCKLHFADKNSLNFELTDNYYKMDSDADIYPVFKYSDAMITDYSTIAFDYLLLDKPILYYPVDLQEYLKKCRGLYGEYNEITAGEKAYNENDLINAMQNIIDKNDKYKKERENLRNKVIKHQDGKNCERFMNWLKSL